MDARWLGSCVFSGLLSLFHFETLIDVFDGTSSDWSPRVFWAQPMTIGIVLIAWMVSALRASMRLQVRVK